jgi:nucleoid DNA-binding protein
MNKNEMDKKYPINISELENIITRIHNKYSIINKSEITLIVKSFFEEMRYLILIGKEININNFIPSVKLIRYKVKDRDATRLKLSTPQDIKNK